MMAVEAKDFPTGAVLSVVTGRLVSRDGIGAIYEVLNWMTGESLYTHQLPRIASEATPVIIGAHPELSQSIEEAAQVNKENWQNWLTKWEERYGKTIVVPKFNEDQHERIDPLSELAEKVHPSRIIAIQS